MYMRKNISNVCKGNKCIVQDVKNRVTKVRTVAIQVPKSKPIRFSMPDIIGLKTHEFENFHKLVNPGLVDIDKQYSPDASVITNLSTLIESNGFMAL